MRRIYTVNNSIQDIVYFALLYFFSFTKSSFKQATFQQLHSLLFTTNTHCYSSIIVYKLFNDILNYLHRRCGIIFGRLFWYLGMSVSVCKIQCYCKNDYLKNDPIVSFFKCTAKRIVCLNR